MRHLTAAPPQDFAVYVARPDTRWCEKEDSDAWEALYAQGYLPYSGAKDLQNIFYSARSARVVLPQFALTSENRRIAKRFDGMFTKTRIPIDSFVADEAFWALCLDYFNKKHGGNAMPHERLRTILANPVLTSILVYTKDTIPVAYVLEARHGSMGHYWFSFYDLSYARQSLGMWLMLDAVQEAKQTGLEHYYLGTVYGPNALYKTNFGPLEWWDGTQWSGDLSALKERSRAE